MKVDVGNITPLPTTSNYVYGVSGTITKNGNALQGVNVTCGGKAAVTGADGTYTITGCTPLLQTVTPTKDGETFTPAPRNVNLTGQTVPNQNFTAN
jgi:hypothetical protein